MNKNKKANLVVSKEPLKSNSPRVLSPSDIVKICAPKIVDVYVPAWDACVRCRIPTSSKIYDIRAKAPTNDEFQKLLFKACLMDFDDAQLAALEESNGLKYFELYTAVISNTDLFTQGLSKANVKN
jgi:hypothetical protein